MTRRLAPRIEGYTDDGPVVAPPPVAAPAPPAWLSLSVPDDLPAWPTPPPPLLLWLVARPRAADAAAWVASARVEGRIGLDGPETDDDIPDVPHLFVRLALIWTPAALLGMGRAALLAIGHLAVVLGLQLAPVVALRAVQAIAETVATVAFVVLVVPWTAPRGQRWRTAHEHLEDSAVPALLTAYVARFQPCWRRLLQGLPALAALAAMAWLLGPSADRAPDYRRAAARAQAAGEYDTARLLLERRLAGLDPGATFELAIALEGAGRPADARAVLRRVVGDSGGDPRAHGWLARRLLACDPGPRGRSLARHHWRLALRADPADAAAHAALADDHVARGEHAEAEPHRLAAARRDRGQRLALARFYDRWARRTAAPARAAELRQRARDCAARLRSELEAADPTDTATLAAVHRLTGAPAGAAELLRARLRARPSGAARAALAACLIDWADQGSGAHAVERLLEAAGLDPASPALERLVARAGRDEADAARIAVLLRARLTGGPGDARTLHALGRIALAAGDSRRAVAHLRAAHRAQASDAVDRDLARALLADGALQPALRATQQLVERAPTAAHRALRARVLVRLRAWAPALADLDVALRAEPAQPALQRLRLAVYDHLDRENRHDG